MQHIKIHRSTATAVLIWKFKTSMIILKKKKGKKSMIWGGTSGNSE